MGDILNREKIAEHIFYFTFVSWCFFDIILRTAFADKINVLFRADYKYSYFDINKIVDVSVLVLLMIVIIFLQHYSHKELVILVVVTMFFLIGTINADNNYLISMLLFIVAAKYADMDRIINLYFYVLLIMIPFVIVMCLIGVLPDNILYRGGLVRHALGFEHPNRLGMRFFQLIACLCYVKKDSAHNFIKYLIMATTAYFVYKVPNSQTAYIGIMLLFVLVLIRNFYDKRGISKNRLMRVMATGAVSINVFSVFISFFNPKKNAVYMAIDKFMSYRFLFGNKMIRYYGVSIWGQKVDTIVKDRKYVGVYHQWYLDNAYLSVLLRFGIVVYIIFTVLIAASLFYYVKQENYAMVAILFTYSVYGIMTTGFYMMSHNIFLLTIASPIYMKTVLRNSEHRHRRFKISWGM